MRKKIIWTISMAILALGFSTIIASATVTQLSSPSEFSPGAITIDFEGLSGPLSDQISGFTFLYTSVVDPATIGNSPGLPLSAATSGTAAAFSAGSRIDFSVPIFEVGMFVSPSFITYIGGLTPVYVDMFLVALDSSDTQIGEVSVPVLRATGSITDIENFTPLFLGLRSDTPVYAVTIDWELPLYPSGSTLFFDDLTIYTEVPPVEDTEAYIDYVSGITQILPDEAFDRPEEDVPDVKNDLTDLFDDALENINEGDYEGAIEKLNRIKEFIYEQIVESAERQEIISLIDGLIAYLETLL